MTRTTVAILILLAVGLGGYLYLTASTRPPNAVEPENRAAERDSGAETATPPN